MAKQKNFLIIAILVGVVGVVIGGVTLALSLENLLSP